MPGSTDALAQDAYDFIEQVRGLATTGEIMDAMHALLRRFGIEYFCFNFLPSSSNQNFEDVLLANRLPAGWLELYNDQRLVHADPSIRHCNRMVRPYRWFKEAPYDPEREPRAVEVVQRARDFGLLDGLVIPIACPAGNVGHVWMGGRTIELPKSELAAIHLMALYAFDRVRRLQPNFPAAVERASLTAREREVIKWIARGKSSCDIGEILAISKRTVEYHALSAYQKLGAANRVQAVMIALREQIVQL